MDQKDEVKKKSDIVTIIGERVDLKKAGRNFKGLCPFHNEDSPSFIVSPELQIFKCFGCGESGDVFSFLEKYEGMDFRESLKYLADRANIKLKVYTGEKGIKDYLFEINSDLVKFYNFILTKHPLGKSAYTYLTGERGISDSTIEKFMLGFSPIDSTIVNKFLIGKKKYSLANIEKTGMGYPRGNFVIDRFRGRVIFPLFDHRGNPLGFAGRVLPGARDDMAKYINSPETEIYHKSEVLYGLNLTREFIKRKKVAIVVEGELDLIACWQIGIKNIVAIKGSVLTDDQVRLISKFANKIILALDADFAGNEAAKRGIKVAQEVGIDVKVASLTNFKDPDEAARNSPEELKKALIHSIDIWDFLIESVFKKYKSSEISKISREIMPILAGIEDKIVQARYVGKVAGKLNVPDEAVSEQLKTTFTKNVTAPSKDIEKVKPKDKRTMLEERFLVLAFKFDQKQLKDPKNKKLIKTLFAKKVIENFENYISIKEFDFPDFAKNLPNEISERFSELMLFESDEDESTENSLKELLTIINELARISIKEERESIEKQMKELEKVNDQTNLGKLQEKFIELTKMQSKLEDRQK